jgi:putative exosortase-associated protein (TIGR04073 family)
MIRKMFLVALISLLVLGTAAPVFCVEDNAMTKLGRGIANMVTFPLEVPEQIAKTNNSDGPFAGYTVGLLKGFGCALGRACVGVYEAATFLIPYPKDFKPVLKDPEYFLENSNY